MQVKNMGDLSAGYNSSFHDWINFLDCWRKAVEQRLDGNRAFPEGINLTNRPGSQEFDRNTEALGRVGARIGRQLPKSYRDFVLVTGGTWFVESAGSLGEPGPSGHFLNIAKIGPFKDIDSVNWKAWDSATRGAPKVEVAPEEYYRYGYREAPLEPQFRFRLSHLSQLIKVGELEQGAVIALNPAEVTSDKEWEAWLLSPQVSAKRYRSFAELMQHISYQDIYESGGSFLPASKLRSSCAGALRTAATHPAEPL